MATINIRVDENIKKQANLLFEELGLDMSTVLNLFLRHAVYYGGIPFEIRKQNAATQAALGELESIRRGKLAAKRYKSVDEMFTDLESEDEV